MARTDAMPRVRVSEENLVALPALAPYFAFGLIALAVTPVLLFAGTDALMAGFYRHPRVLAAVHGAAVGWGTSIAFGALQQMTAVVGATTLHSTRLAAASFLPFGVGAVGLIIGFYTLHPIAFGFAAAGIPLGAAAVVYNVGRTIATAQPTRRWLIIEPFVKAALVYVLIAFTAGAALALNLTQGKLGSFWNEVFPLHINMAVAGWFLMLVTGISYHLLTFFGLTDKGTSFRFPHFVRIILHGALGFGIVASVVAAFSGGGMIVDGLRTVAALGFSVAGGLFVWDARGVYVRPPRQRANVVHFYVRLAHAHLAIAVSGLFVWTLVRTVGGEAGDWKHYVALGTIVGAGWLTNTILGYLHRILAFFVWHNKYWGRGREPGVPGFRDMVHSPLAATGMWLFNAGVVGFVFSLYFHINLMWTVAIWIIGTAVIAGNLVWTMLR